MQLNLHPPFIIGLSTENHKSNKEMTKNEFDNEMKEAKKKKSYDDDDRNKQMQ